MTDAVKPIEPPEFCLPTSLKPECISVEPSKSLNENIADFLSFIGLTPERSIDSNTPLDIIRHFSEQQTYNQAFDWASNNFLAVTVCIVLYAFFRFWQAVLQTYDISVVWGEPIGIVRRTFYICLGIYGISSASVLLNDTVPLNAEDFIKSCLWVLSVAYLLLKAHFFVQALGGVLVWVDLRNSWGISKFIKIIFTVAILNGAGWLWFRMHW